MSYNNKPPARPADPVVAARARGQAVQEQVPQTSRRDPGRPQQPRGPPKVSGPVTEPAATAGLLWGGRAIARYADLELSEFYNLHRTGALDGIVAKLGRKTLVATKADVDALPHRAARAKKVKTSATKVTP